eukprot:126789-Amphidinium_carterae.1
MQPRAQPDAKQFVDAREVAGTGTRRYILATFVVASSCCCAHRCHEIVMNAALARELFCDMYWYDRQHGLAETIGVPNMTTLAMYLIHIRSLTTKASACAG